MLIEHHPPLFVDSLILIAKVAVDVSQLNTSIYEYWVLCLGQGKTMSLEVVAFASPYVCVYIYVCVSLKKKVYVCICRKTWKLQKHVYNSEYIWSSVGQAPWGWVFSLACYGSPPCGLWWWGIWEVGDGWPVLLLMVSCMYVVLCMWCM